MAKVVGHGMLEKYSREIFLQNPIKLQELLTIIGIPDVTFENALFLKGNCRLKKDDLVSDEDEVHFYLVPLGG
jgi:hypothetical protein